MKKKLVCISEVLYSPHYHVIKGLTALMPIFVPTSVAKKDLQHHFTDGETNGTSTAWWWVDPLGCSQRPQRGADLCTSIKPQEICTNQEAVLWGAELQTHTQTSDLPLAHLQPLLASALCFSARPAVTWQCRSVPAACRDSLASTKGSWGRMEMHCGSSSHPSQDLKFPFSPKPHTTWHFHKIYLLFKGFKQTLQAAVEVLTDV